MVCNGDLMVFNGDLMVFNGDLMVFNGDLMVFNGDLMVFNGDWEWWFYVHSGKHRKNDGKSPCSMVKSTINGGFQ